MPYGRRSDSLWNCESRIIALKSAIRSTVATALAGFSLDQKCQAISALGFGTGVAFEPSGIESSVSANKFKH
jgi:hypothetical protein